MTSPLRSFATAGEPTDTTAREAVELLATPLYDPPGGWRYGFPKPYKPLPGEDLETTLLRDGYPQREIDAGSARFCRFIGLATASNDNAPEREHSGADGTSEAELIPSGVVGSAQLWLDMDGVLADFDSAACAALGTDNTYKWEWIHGTKAFWAGLNANPNFFLDLPPMRDAWFLLESVRHLKPKVLTALPKTGADAVAAQKREWIARHVGDLEVVTCLTREKPDYCQPGDVLVDDRAVNRAAWEKKGGRYVLHTDALSSVRQLREMGVL